MITLRRLWLKLYSFISSAPPLLDVPSSSSSSSESNPEERLPLLPLIRRSVDNDAIELVEADKDVDNEDEYKDDDDREDEDEDEAANDDADEEGKVEVEGMILLESATLAVSVFVD